MEENYKKSIRRVKKITESVHRRVKIYSEISRIDDKGTAKSMRVLQKAPSPGKKIQKIGFGLVLTPEPITTPIGIALMATGKILEKKYNSSTISDVGETTKKTLRSLRDIRENI